MYIFNRKKIIKQGMQKHRTETHDVLEHAAKTITERVLWRTTPVDRILIIGHHLHIIKQYLMPVIKSQAEVFFQYDDCVFDSEFIPYGVHTFDLIISFFDIQYLNDVPGYLKQLEYCLVPNGLFMGVFVGGQSFFECAEHLFFEESVSQKVIAVRFHPNISVSSIADLLKRAGFDCPIVDKDSLKIEEDSIYNHILTLRKLNATNKMHEQYPFPKSLIAALHARKSLNIDLLYVTGLGHQKSKKLEGCSKFYALFSF